MLKILQARLQQYVNREHPDVQAGFRKVRGTRVQIANIHWIIEKAREFQKNIYFCFLTMPKPLTVWITIKCGKFWKTWEYQTTRPASWETYMQVRMQQLELETFPEDEMAGWHHWLNGRESEWTPGVGDGQGGLACCDSWGRKESDTTESLNWLTDHSVVCLFILLIVPVSAKVI